MANQPKTAYDMRRCKHLTDILAVSDPDKLPSSLERLCELWEQQPVYTNDGNLDELATLRILAIHAQAYHRD